MSTDIIGLCREHSFEPAQDLCRMCGAECCETCLVYPFGKPLCKTCAIAAAGVRSSGTHTPLSKRDMKKRLKAFETAQALKREPEETAPILTDPLVGHDPIGPPLGEGLEHLGAPDSTDPPVSDELAQAAARLAGVGPPPPAPEPVADDDDPGTDIAPPIDWNKPFG